MKKYMHVIASIIMTLSMISFSDLSLASTGETKTKVITKKSKVVVVEPAVVDEDEAEPNVLQNNSFDYKCELGNFLTIYTNAEDDQHVALRWKKRLYRMTRVETTTGANRFENRKAGFVFIGIPAKGLLLDSHKGKQLANECKTIEPILIDAKGVEETRIEAKEIIIPNKEIK